MKLPELNFEDAYEFRFRRDKDKFFIYDLARKTWLLLTPEEWVRQHWVHFYHITQKRNLSALILEKKILLHGTTKRIDLIVTEKTAPTILIECKAPHIALTQKTFEQTARYNSVVGASEIILSNGLKHISAKYADSRYEFFEAAY